MKKRRILFFVATVVLSTSCNEHNALEQALQAAGENRPELEKVLAHYSQDPADSLKLRAAEFLIENMPGHYSYEGDEVLKYYEMGEKILLSDLSPAQQNDSLFVLGNEKFPTLQQHTVADITIMQADYLIKNIEDAFDLWENKPWSKHLDFDQFCEYILPYKCCELQQLDYWRDTLSTLFGVDLSLQFCNDKDYDTPFRAYQFVRRNIRERVSPTRASAATYPFLSASNIYKLTYGSCTEYVRLGVATMRSLGIPMMIYSVPQWGRYRVGHEWCTMLSDKGKDFVVEWDISSDPGGSLFLHERIPKIYRHTYAINHDRMEYRVNAKYQHPFDLFQEDATDEFIATNDLSIPLIRKDLKDKYVYIAVFNGKQIQWNIIGYGVLRKGKAEFKKMGRNIAYLAFGYDGEKLVPISHPFILHSNGEIEYVIADNSATEKITMRRKFWQSAHVADMHRRMLKGRIQASNKRDFSDSVTLYTIDSLEYPDLIPLSAKQSYRYWRYLSPKGSFGNIAELHFFQEADSVKLTGNVISSLGKQDSIGMSKRPFDGDWFSYFDTPSAPDGSWVGLDMGKAVTVDRVRCIPRTDDNYIRVGEEYELCYWDTDGWKSLGKRIADDNVLVYSDAPKGALFWLKNHTRGLDERIFTYENGKQVWW